MSISKSLERIIAFNPIFVDLGIGVTGALFLSQVCYWDSKTTDEQGWFYKTADDWHTETRLSKREQMTARNRLVEKGYITERKKGVPCKLHFRLNRDNLDRDLEALLGGVKTRSAQSAQLEKGECAKRTTRSAQSAQLEVRKASDKKCAKRTTITEITAEITAETTTQAQSAPAVAPPCEDPEQLNLTGKGESSEGEDAGLPNWMPSELWDDFKAHRKQLKAPMTERAKMLAIGKIGKLRDEGHKPEDVIEQSILNGWKGLFPIKNENRERGNVHPFKRKADYDDDNVMDFR